MKATRIAILVTAALALSGAVALAASNFQTGDYSGKTDHKVGREPNLKLGTVSFHVSGQKIINASWTVRVRCTTGKHTNWKLGAASRPIDSDGKFSIKFPSGHNTGQNRLSGQVKPGGHASGTLRRTDREKSNGDTDPNGVSCDSGVVKWSATRK